MSKFILMSEGSYYDEFVERSRHDSYEEAEEAAGVLFDNGDEGDFRIVEEGEEQGWRLRGYTFMKMICPECGALVRSRHAMMSYDCHGIQFRKLCPDCYNRIMNGKGYDGEHYTEEDECLDEDY